MGQRLQPIVPAAVPRADLLVKTLHFENGVTYTGQVNSKNQQHGLGKLIYPGKMEYTGEFQNGEIHGLGTMKHVNGTHYKGQYRHNRYNGRGVLRYSNLQEYRGEFKNGLRHGNGVLYNSDGTPRRGGRWKDDKLSCWRGCCCCCALC